MSVTTVEEAVVGYSPLSGVMNVGFPCAAPEWVDVGFTDVLPFEGAGADVILFDARFSVDDFAVQVRAVGSADFESVHVYPSSSQTPTGEVGPSGSEIWGVEVDFEDFGLPLETAVDAVRVIGNCEVTPDAEFDLLMAAVVDRSCLLDEDCDDADPCSVESCLDGTCSYEAAAAGAPCDQGVCLGEWPTQCVQCVEVSDCTDDDDPCTFEACADGGCTSSPAPAGTPCEDGVCSPDGACVACAADEHCDDGNACTADACVDQVCQHEGECSTTVSTTGAGGSPPVGEGGSGAGGGGAVPTPPVDDGCSCGVPRHQGIVPAAWVVFALLVLARSLFASNSRASRGVPRSAERPTFIA